MTSIATTATTRSPSKSRASARTMLLLLAAVVAVPLAWLAIHYYTADLVVKAPVTVGLFLAAFLIVAVISVATLLWLVNKASRINPSEVMKSE